MPSEISSALILKENKVRFNFDTGAPCSEAKARITTNSGNIKLYIVGIHPYLLSRSYLTSSFNNLYLLVIQSTRTELESALWPRMSARLLPQCHEFRVARETINSNRGAKHRQRSSLLNIQPSPFRYNSLIYPRTFRQAHMPSYVIFQPFCTRCTLEDADCADSWYVQCTCESSVVRGGKSDKACRIPWVRI